MMKPILLYHGSQYHLERLTPQQAHDGLSDVGSAMGVFATSLRELALVFALGAIPDAQGRITRLVRSIDPLRVIFLEGQPNYGGLGYLYTVSSASFAQLDGVQWISTEEVVPLTTEVIQADDYAYLVEQVPEDERLRLLEAFRTHGIS